MSASKLKFRRLVKKLSYLKSDLEYHKFEHKERREIFYADFAEFMENNKVYEYSEEKLLSKMTDVYKPNKLKPIQEEPLEVEETEMESQNNKMFKDIAKKTHPDIQQDPEKVKIFVKANEAKKNNDWFTLYELCEALEIETPEPSEEHLEWFEQEIINCDKIISGIVATFEWKYSEPNANKERLMTIYCDITCKKVE